MIGMPRPLSSSSHKHMLYANRWSAFLCKMSADCEELEPQAAKKARIETSKDDSNDRLKLLSFGDFNLERVLCKRPENKMITLLGKFAGSDEKGVLVVEKQPISEDCVKGLLSCEAKVNSSFHNDIYSQYVVEGACGLGEVRVMGVYPATDSHIRKYSEQNLHMVHETPQIYQSVTKPFIQKQAFTLEWVYNILDGTAESERVIFSDPDPETGFILVPDLKWDRSDIQNLYMLALVRRRDILSMRELRKEHLPLLKNILNKGKDAISREFGVSSDELRIYFHYQPSYYHLHVHFTHLKYAAPKTLVGEAHLLEDVIDNIEHIDGDFYLKKTLSFCLKDSSPLWVEFAKLQ